MPYQRDADEITADVREVEIDLQSAPHGSPEAARLRDEIVRLRVEYESVREEADEHHVVLAPFPLSDDPDPD